LTKSRREYNSTLQALQDENYNLENQNSKLSKKVQELNLEINDLKITLNELTMDQKDYTNAIEELTDKLALKTDEVTEATKTIEDFQALVSLKQSNFDKETTSLKSTITQLEEKIAKQEKENEDVNQSLDKSQQELLELKEEVKKIDELKSEIHNKQLSIGKLRHEAIILNEHLTKALSMLRQGGDSSKKSVDKELISNVLISFLQFPRGDTKKFEALGLIGALLEWDELQKLAAGLTHVPNTKNQQTKLDKDGNEVLVRQSFVSLWTEFLEKESSGK